MSEIDELWRESNAASFGLSKDELAGVLLRIGAKHNYGLPPGTTATRMQVAGFWRGLQLQDLALAHACALGRVDAWQHFVTQYRTALIQMSIAITQSAAHGQELADSLYADLFGVGERGEQRRSPLSYYSGRGSLKGFLRATLAQRRVDQIRRSSREMPLEAEDFPAASPPASTASRVLSLLQQALVAILALLLPEERFLLAAWFLDRRTLLEISQVLGVHEATVSRRIQRLTGRLHHDLLKKLRDSGMSRAAAEEALGTDPRDLNINLRSLLQASQSSPFLKQGASAGQEQK